MVRERERETERERERDSLGEIQDEHIISEFISKAYKRKMFLS
jgi:hypothetical protein